MPFESGADRLAMLAGLGGQCVCGPRATFTAVLKRPHVAVGEGVPVDDFAPTLTARSCDVERAGAAVGATLRIDGEYHIVRSVRPDGTGMTELMLEAA
jgi:hypothetical protein